MKCCFVVVVGFFLLLLLLFRSVKAEIVLTFSSLWVGVGGGDVKSFLCQIQLLVC